MGSPMICRQVWHSKVVLNGLVAFCVCSVSNSKSLNCKDFSKDSAKSNVRNCIQFV